MVMPIPRESEKNICPPAEASTLIQPKPVKGSKFGLSMNSRPLSAPSRVTLLIMTIKSRINKAGMAIVENFSIPFETPPLTMSMVRRTKMREKITVCG